MEKLSLLAKSRESNEFILAEEGHEIKPKVLEVFE